MTDRLDTLLSQLRDTETDHQLDALEPAVRDRRHAAKRADDRAALRLVAVLFALLVGTGVGGVAATAVASAPVAFLDAGASLAPSNLLDGRR